MALYFASGLRAGPKHAQPRGACAPYARNSDVLGSQRRFLGRIQRTRQAADRSRWWLSPMATPRRRAIAGTPGRCSRGRPRWTPVALICSGTTARQVVYRGALGHLARLDSLDLPTPVIAVVGEV